MAKIVEEVYKTTDIQKEAFGTISKEMQLKIEDTNKFYQKFSVLLNEKPYTLQKCSLHGIVLAKEIISKAREEASE